MRYSPYTCLPPGPQCVDKSERFIGGLDRIHYDPKCDQVIDKRHIQLLSLHLLIDAVDMFGTAAYTAFKPKFGHPRLEYLLHLSNVANPVLFGFSKPCRYFLIGFGMKTPEGEVFQFLLHPIDTEPARERRVDIKSFLGEIGAKSVRPAGSSSNAVKPVSKLYEDHPDVPGNRHDHLADIFGLTLFSAAEDDLGQLGNALYYHGNLWTEHLREIFRGNVFFFQAIMKQAGSDTLLIETHPCENRRNC